MPDAVLDALASRAGSAAAPEDDGDPVLKALSTHAESTAAPQSAAASSGAAPRGTLMRGVGEAALHLGSAALALPFAAGNSVRELTHNPAGLRAQAAAKAAQEAQANATYQPRTQIGQNIAHVIDFPFQKLAEGGDWVADKVAGLTGNEYLAGAADTAVQAAPALLGLRGTRAAVADAAGTAGRGLANPLSAPRGFADAPSGHAFSRESLGAAAAAPQLENLSPALRTEIERQASRGGVDREAVTRQVQADQLPVRMQLTEGQATQNPELISQEMNKRAKEPAFANRFNQQNAQLAENLDEIRATESPNAVGNDHLQNGQALVDMYKRRDATDTQEIRGAYKELTDANGGNFPVDGVAFVDAADAALKKQMKGRYLPSAIEADLKDFRDGEPMTFEHFENLRTNLAAEARKADRSGDGNAAHAVNIVREQLESLPMNEATGQVKAIADRARSLAKARFDRIKADPAYKAVVDDDASEGHASPLADDFVQKYIVRGKAANIAKMREHLQAEEGAGETIASGALSYIKSKSGIDLYSNQGNFSQAGYNRALGELRPKIDQLVSPETAEHLEHLGDVARYTQAQPRGSYVNNSNTFTAALGHHAAGITRTLIDVGVPGAQIGTKGAEFLAKRSERKAIKDALKPGAGIKLNKLLTPKDDQ